MAEDSIMYDEELVPTKLNKLRAISTAFLKECIAETKSFFDLPLKQLETCGKLDYHFGSKQTSFRGDINYEYTLHIHTFEYNDGTTLILEKTVESDCTLNVYRMRIMQNYSLSN